MTLVEVLVAALIFTVVIVGSVAFSVNGRVEVERAGKLRTACQIAAERLERARHAGYASLVDGDGDGLVEKGSIVVDGTSFNWTLTAVAALADAADNQSAYKHVEVTVDWPTSQRGAVVLRSAVAP